MAHQVNPETVINRLAARIGQLTAENAMLEAATAELQQLLDKAEVDKAQTDTVEAGKSPAA